VVTDARSPDDAELLLAWRNGDTNAGEALFDRHADAVARLLANKVDDDVAELLQATFVRILDGGEQLRPGRAFRTYAMTTARNMLRKHLRERQRGRDIDFEVDSIAELARRPSSILGERDEHRLLLEGLRRLPIDDQLMIELYYWEGMDSPAIGDVMGMPAPSVRTRLRRARERLGQLMAELTAEPGGLRRTVEDIDAWAAELRARLLPTR
jgi:RNA polymerase sigma factor (sigma-70 family)